MDIQKGMMPIFLTLENVSAMTVQKDFLFPLPQQSINGRFGGEEHAGVSALYKYAPRYKKWLLYKTETFIGYAKLMKVD